MPLATSTRIITPAPTSTDKLDQAVAALRHVDPESWDGEKGKALDEAVNTIESAGQEGERRLKAELVAIQQAGEKDPTFQILAAWMIWDIGGLDEVESISKLWTSIPANEWYYRWFFMPAMQAAATQDLRAAPMLKVLLSDKEGKPYPMLEYPLTHEFVWGAYGSVGLPVLYEVLQTSDNPVAIESSINLLAQAQYLPALPEIRKALDNPNPDVRVAAIMALGRFGHPDDYDRLIFGLASTDQALLNKYVYALNEFGDVRAVPHLIPLLQNPNQRNEVAWGLSNYVASPEGLVALMDAKAKTNDQDFANLCDKYVQNVLESAGLTWEAFQSLPAKEQQKVTDGYRYADITLKPGEKPITHDQLLEVVAEWRDTGYIQSEKWDWVETRHILPIATADDINLLLDGKAKFYLRLSDECIYDVRIVDDLIKWIGRSRYR